MSESAETAATTPPSFSESGPDNPLLPLGSDGPDDLPAGADADELARSRGDVGDEHASFTVDRDDPRRDEGGSLMPSEEPM